MEREKPSSPLSDTRQSEPVSSPAGGDAFVVPTGETAPPLFLPDAEQGSEGTLMLEQFAEAITSGAALEAWGALPYLQRLRLRLLTEQLLAAFDALDPRLGGKPAGSSWQRAFRAEQPQGAHATGAGEHDDRSSFFTVEQLARYGGVLPPVGALPDTHPLDALATEQATVAETLTAAVDHLDQTASLNPAFA